MGKKITGRSKILEKMAQYPDGINANRLFKEVAKDYVITQERLATVLCHMVGEGIVRKQRNLRCDCCGRLSTGYRLPSYMKLD